MGHNQVLSRLFLIFSQTPSHPILTSRIPELVAFGYYSSLWVLHPKWLGYSRHFYKIMPLQSSKQNLDASNKGFSPTFSTPWYFIHFTLTPIHPTRVLQPGSKDIVHYPPPRPTICSEMNDIPVDEHTRNIKQNDRPTAFSEFQISCHWRKSSGHYQMTGCYFNLCLCTVLSQVHTYLITFSRKAKLSINEMIYRTCKPMI